jgi:hypothetical protein
MKIKTTQEFFETLPVADAFDLTLLQAYALWRLSVGPGTPADEFYDAMHLIRPTVPGTGILD